MNVDLKYPKQNTNTLNSTAIFKKILFSYSQRG